MFYLQKLRIPTRFRTLLLAHQQSGSIRRDDRGPGHRRRFQWGGLDGRELSGAVVESAAHGQEYDPEVPLRSLKRNFRPNGGERHGRDVHRHVRRRGAHNATMKMALLIENRKAEVLEKVRGEDGPRRRRLDGIPGHGLGA